MNVASTVEVYDPDTFELVQSKREYIKATESLTYPVEVGSYYSEIETRHRTVYLDVSNGLVVHDVRAYETWIESE